MDYYETLSKLGLIGKCVSHGDDDELIISKKNIRDAKSVFMDAEIKNNRVHILTGYILTKDKIIRITCEDNFNLEVTQYLLSGVIRIQKKIRQDIDHDVTSLTLIFNDGKDLALIKPKKDSAKCEDSFNYFAIQVENNIIQFIEP